MDFWHTAEQSVTFINEVKCQNALYWVFADRDESIFARPLHADQ